MSSLEGDRKGDSMKERPILFGGAMVRAILEGKKSQTRRVVKPEPPYRSVWDADSKLFHLPGSRLGVMRHCPYGGAGDRLWVRETHAIVPATAYAGSTDDGRNQIPHKVSPDGLSWAVYREGWSRVKPGRWRPSIHMPRWASRLLLEVTAVRVERVGWISGVDAVEEGMELDFPGGHYGAYGRARQAFRDLWDSINAKRGHGWEENPWVWVVEFRRVVEASRGME